MTTLTSAALTSITEEVALPRDNSAASVEYTTHDQLEQECKNIGLKPLKTVEENSDKIDDISTSEEVDGGSTSTSSSSCCHSMSSSKETTVSANVSLTNDSISANTTQTSDPSESLDDSNITTVIPESDSNPSTVYPSAVAESAPKSKKSKSKTKKSNNKESDTFEDCKNEQAERELKREQKLQIAQSIYNKIPLPIGVMTMFLAEPACKFVDKNIIDPSVFGTARFVRDVANKFLGDDDENQKSKKESKDRDSESDSGSLNGDNSHESDEDGQGGDNGTNSTRTRKERRNSTNSDTISSIVAQRGRLSERDDGLALSRRLNRKNSPDWPETQAEKARKMSFFEPDCEPDSSLENAWLVDGQVFLGSENNPDPNSSLLSTSSVVTSKTQVKEALFTGDKEGFRQILKQKGRHDHWEYPLTKKERNDRLYFQTKLECEHLQTERVDLVNAQMTNSHHTMLRNRWEREQMLMNGGTAIENGGAGAVGEQNWRQLGNSEVEQ